MNFSPRALLDFINEASKSHPWTSFAMIWGLFGAPIWLFIIPGISNGFRIPDHFYYLVYRNPNFRQEELGKAVIRINKLINEQEYLSFDNQQQVVDAITYEYQRYKVLKEQGKIGVSTLKCPVARVTDPSECYSIVLRANSNIHDFIRSFLQVNDVYIRLLRSGNDDGSVHRFIADFYGSSSRLLKNQPKCRDVYQAYSTLRSLHNRIDIISPDVKDSLNLEVLRMLTFSAAFLETNCPDSAPKGAYLEAMDIYNKRASEIVERSYKKPSNSTYLRKLFWLDFSRYVAEQKKGDSGDQYLQRMRDKLPPEFLKSKLDQNQKVTIE